MFTQVFLEKVDSTHLYGLRKVAENEEGSFFFYAGEQTHGVGRKGASWIGSGKENLLGTFFFSIPNPVPLHNLAQLLSHSIMHVLEKEAFEPLFKWPNDILLSHKKVCGVLCDSKDHKAVLSLGLNVNMRKNSLDLITIPATSLFEETQTLFPLDKLRFSIVETFSRDLALFFAKGFAPFFPAFASKLAFTGKQASINGYQGIIEGLHPDGRLILKQHTQRQLLASGSLEILL